MRRLLANALRGDGFEVIEASSGAELVERIRTHLIHPKDGRTVDLIISDIRMPWASGLTVLEGLRRHNRATPVI
ncbi:MAG: response regulator, partial [Myxococcales bacterium]|nr:response regulator [Myxococcales bacterium]